MIFSLQKCFTSPSIIKGLVFSRFSDKSDGHASKFFFSHLNPGTGPFCVALYFTIVLAVSLKMPVERSSALESCVPLRKSKWSNKETFLRKNMTTAGDIHSLAWIPPPIQITGFTIIFPFVTCCKKKIKKAFLVLNDSNSTMIWRNSEQFSLLYIKIVFSESLLSWESVQNVVNVEIF